MSVTYIVMLKWAGLGGIHIETLDLTNDLETAVKSYNCGYWNESINRSKDCGIVLIKITKSDDGKIQEEVLLNGKCIVHDDEE